MIDNYSHLDNILIYAAESVPGPASESLEYKKIVECYNQQLSISCTCASFCSLETCDCHKASGGGNYTRHSTSHNMLLKCKMDGAAITPIIECNDMCSCKDNCGNRVVQYGPVDGLFIKNCQNPKKGLGIFTMDLIISGTFICEYAGEIITRSQAAIRQEYNTQQGLMNYIFCLNEHNQGEIVQTFVDPSFIGNIGRYINHSCDPNCIILPVRVNTPIPKLAIFSCKDILPHTEITFQYGTLGLRDLDASIERKVCLCHSSKCMGWMPYEVY